MFRKVFLRSLSQTAKKARNFSIKTLNDYGQYGRAFEQFNLLVKEKNVNVISLLNILETCTKSLNIDRARQIERLINQSKQFKDNIRLQTSLINFYMKSQQIDQGQIEKSKVFQREKNVFLLAERIFNRIRHFSQCDVIVYNAMIVRH